MVFKFVLLICGEFAAANVTVHRGEKGPSNALSVLGDWVAN
jgi:hypothetical protein